MATQTVNIDLNGESGRLWMAGASMDRWAKKCVRSYNFCRKEYGSKDPRTVQAKEDAERAKATAVEAERKFREYMEIH